jgi:hypothetical protein
LRLLAQSVQDCQGRFLPSGMAVTPAVSDLMVLPVCGAENFKFSRLVLQSWLQSLPELVIIGIILYRDISRAGPAVVINGPILLQVGHPHSHDHSHIDAAATAGTMAAASLVIQQESAFIGWGP